MSTKQIKGLVLLVNTPYPILYELCNLHNVSYLMMERTWLPYCWHSEVLASEPISCHLLFRTKESNPIWVEYPHEHLMFPFIRLFLYFVICDWVIFAKRNWWVIMQAVVPLTAHSSSWAMPESPKRKWSQRNTSSLSSESSALSEKRIKEDLNTDNSTEESSFSLQDSEQEYPGTPDQVRPCPFLPTVRYLPALQWHLILSLVHQCLWTSWCLQ